MGEWRENMNCPKCLGYGWLWWDELDEYYGPAVETGTDDTKYSCDHWCHKPMEAAAQRDMQEVGG